MFILLLLLFLLLAVFAYFLFAPFYLEVDTTHGLYRVRLHRLVSFRVFRAEQGWAGELRVAGWRKRIDFAAQPVVVVKEQAPRKPRQKSRRRFGWKKIRAVLGSFKIVRCRVSIDTGDDQWNGLLYPLFYFAARRSGRDIRINFTGDVEIVLCIKNNLARMGWAYLRTS